VLDLEDGPAAVADDDEREALAAIISNSKLGEHFLALGRDLDVMEPKLPEDVYKSHLAGGNGGLSGRGKRAVWSGDDVWRVCGVSWKDQRLPGE